MNNVESSISTSNDFLIQEVLSCFTAGWNSHNANAFSEVFAEDADFTNVMGITKKGKEEIVKLHDPLFKTIWNSSTLTITSSTIRYIKPDVASVDARWILEGLKDMDGNDRPSRNGLLSFIITNEQQQWSIAVMHNMDLPGSMAQKC